MKLKKILSGAVVAAALCAGSASAQFSYVNGDLIAAFGKLGSTYDVLVNLGSISTYQNGNLPPTTFNLNAVLTATFGTIDSSIYWAVLGVNKTTINPYDHAVTQTSALTVWSTLARTDVAVQTDAPNLQPANGNAVTDIRSLGLNTIAGAGILDYAAGIEQVSQSVGNFTTIMNNSGLGYLGNLQGDWSYNTLNNGVGVSDLYQAAPGSSASQATYLGDFSLTSGGALTFYSVPEPSTWAMIGSGSLALLALRRRK